MKKSSTSVALLRGINVGTHNRIKMDDLKKIVTDLGYLWMLWDREKQCWQDKIATTVVVPVQYYPVT